MMLEGFFSFSGYANEKQPLQFGFNMALLTENDGQ